MKKVNEMHKLGIADWGVLLEMIQGIHSLLIFNSTLTPSVIKTPRLCLRFIVIRSYNKIFDSHLFVVKQTNYTLSSF